MVGTIASRAHYAGLATGPRLKPLRLLLQHCRAFVLCSPRQCPACITFVVILSSKDTASRDSYHLQKWSSNSNLFLTDPVKPLGMDSYCVL